MSAVESHAPRYAPHGWVHWPELPAQSMYLQRLLGSAQEGGSTISECFLAASKIDPADPESWYAEWMTLARSNTARAVAAAAEGRDVTASSNYLRAASYLRAAEQFLSVGDERRGTCFQSMLECSRNWLDRVPAAERVHIEMSSGVQLSAYYLPAGSSDPAPAVIAFGGLDGSKDELLPRMWRHAAARGVALLLVDLPGQGEVLRCHGVPAVPAVETAVTPCVDFLANRPEVDSSRVALWGVSLGGVYSARAASYEHRLAAVVSDGVIFNLAQALQVRWDSGERDWQLLQWVFGCTEPAQVISKAKGLSLASAIPEIRCPWLIVQGEHDFLGLPTALDAHACARVADISADLKVFTASETGASHCQADNPTLGQEFIWDWLMPRLTAASALPTSPPPPQSTPTWRANA